MHHDAVFRTWNVFRRRHDEGLCCAVSAEAPLPPFLLSGEWNFGFAVADGDPPVTGFSIAAAELGIGFNGFYLFLAFGTPHGTGLGGERHRRPGPAGAESRVRAFPHLRAPRRRLARQEDRCPSTPTG